MAKECDCMKKAGGVSVILYGMCAVIWTIRVILDVVNHTVYVPGFSFVLNVLCAVLWIACFVVNLKRYLSNKEEQKE